jgi:hypothetical protein
MNNNKVVYTPFGEPTYQCDKVVEFDGTLIKLENDNGGGFMTVVPISPLAYRKTIHKTQAHITCDTDVMFTTFKITDDYGHVHMLSIPNDQREAIDHAIACAKTQELMSNPNEEFHDLNCNCDSCQTKSDVERGSHYADDERGTGENKQGE